jgi:hypothetical protein
MELFRRGWSNDAVQVLFEEYSTGIGERYAGGKTDLRKEIERLRQKFDEKAFKDTDPVDLWATNEDAVACDPNDAEIERLARLSLLEYDQQPKKAAEALGVRVSMLDRMVGSARDRRDHDTEFRETPPEIAGINAEYALVLSGNKASVMKFEDVTKFRLLQIGAFKQWFSKADSTRQCIGI